MERIESKSPMAHFGPNTPFKPHDTLDETVRASFGGGMGGIFIAAVRNALAKRNVGAMSVFTRGAPIIGLAAAGPASYIFFSRSMMNLREKNDAWAAAFGGFMMGSVLGLPTKSYAICTGLGVGVGIIQGTFFFLGNRYDSFKEENDEFERKEVLRRTTRIPIEQTIAEIGEGRGIRAPGFEERRREKLKEKYGFDVNPVKATVEGSL